MHDTEGWKSLDTSLNSLRNLVEVMGSKLFNFKVDNVFAVIKKAVSHMNRFVREIGYYMINVVIETQ
jgi:hypothetical protein